MLIALKVILGTLALILFYRSGRWIFDTENKARQHGLEYTNATGSNYLKGDIGGMLCFGSIMWLIGIMYWLFKRNLP